MRFTSADVAAEAATIEGAVSEKAAAYGCLQEHEMDGDDNCMDFYNRVDIAWEYTGCGWWVEPCELDEPDRCEQSRDINQVG